MLEVGRHRPPPLSCQPDTLDRLGMAVGLGQLSAEEEEEVKAADGKGGGGDWWCCGGKDGRTRTDVFPFSAEWRRETGPYETPKAAALTAILPRQSVDLLFLFRARHYPLLSSSSSLVASS